MALMKIGAAAGTLRRYYYRPSYAAYERPRLGASAASTQVRGQIIVLSAYLTKENIQAYEELKVDMMFAKPFDCEELQLAMNLLTKDGSERVSAPLTAPA
jgi:hypothetical protein